MKRLSRYLVLPLVLAALVVPALAARPISPPLVVALGDSITYGFGLAAPATQNYAAQYARGMHGSLVDLAVPGYDCADVLQKELPKLPRGAAIVIVNCGTNDVGGFGFTSAGLPDGHKRVPPANHQQLRDAMGAFARILSDVHVREPKAAIVVLTIRHWQRMTGDEDPRFASAVNAWNEALKAKGVRVVDVSTDKRMYQPAYFQADLIHPSLAGSAAIASDLDRP